MGTNALRSLGPRTKDQLWKIQGIKSNKNQMDKYIYKGLKQKGVKKILKNLDLKKKTLR